MLVGNGCTNWTYDTMPATVVVAYERAIYNTGLRDKIVAENCDYTGLEFDRPPTEICNGYLN